MELSSGTTTTAPLRDPRAFVVRSGWLLVLAGMVACSGSTPPITGKEWRVAAVNGIMNPVGVGGRPLTMTFDDSTKRVYGFAGCNRFSAGYTLRGDSLSFTQVISTRMACEGFDTVEAAYLRTLPALREYSRSDSLLILSGEGSAIRLR